eukprot:Pgem_evm1s5820
MTHRQFRLNLARQLVNNGIGGHAEAEEANIEEVLVIHTLLKQTEIVAIANENKKLQRRK